MSEHELWNELGNLYFMSGTYNQAAYAYNRSIQLDSGFGRPYCNLALTYVKQGRFEEAVSLYQRSIELLIDDKEKAITWYRLGDVYRHLKDYRDAIMAYQQADQLDADMSQECRESQQVLYGGSGGSVDLRKQQALPSFALHASDQDLSCPADPSVTVTETEHIHTNVELVQAAEQSLPNVDALPALDTDMTAPADNLPPVPMMETDITQAVLSAAAETVSELAMPAPGWTDDQELFSSFEPETEVYIPDYTDEQMNDWLPQEEPEPLRSQIEVDASRNADVVLQPVPGAAALRPERRQSDYQAAASHEEVCIQEIPMPPISELELDIPDEQLASMFIIPEEQKPQPQLPEVTSNSQLTAPGAIEDLQEIESEITKFRHVVQTNPRNASAWDTLGTLYKSARKYRDAILAYQQAVAVDPAKAPYHHHLGIIYAIEGREEDAMKAFQEVIELDPNHSLANATLGGYYRKMGLEELAQRHIGKAMKNFYNSENEYNRACLEALCGNIEQSIELLRIALKNKQTYVDWVLRDPDLDSIRRDPRFKQLISDYNV